MIKLRQAIVVEGRYDKNVLSQLVDAPVIETHGFGVMKDKRLLGFLRQVAAARGLIILTDSDGAGFVIRNFLKGALPPEQVLHAYIPDVPGKERRKRAPGREGKLGVEGMPPEVLLEALRRAGAQAEDSPEPPDPITHTAARRPARPAALILFDTLIFLFPPFIFSLLRSASRPNAYFAAQLVSRMKSDSTNISLYLV